MEITFLKIGGDLKLTKSCNIKLVQGTHISFPDLLIVNILPHFLYHLLCVFMCACIFFPELLDSKLHTTWALILNTPLRIS